MDPITKTQLGTIRPLLGKVAGVFRFYPGVPFEAEPYFWTCRLCGGLGTTKTEPTKCPSCGEDWKANAR